MDKYVEQVQPRKVVVGGDEIDKLVGLEIPSHDYISLTYVPSGNGVGEIQTVTYKQGGASGTVVGVLTLAYDSSNKLSTVTKS